MRHRIPSLSRFSILSFLPIFLFMVAGGSFLSAEEALRCVEFAQVKGGFPLVQGKQAASLYLDKGDYAGVSRAAADLQADIERVTGIKPQISNELSGTLKTAVIIGTLGKNGVIDTLAKSGKINTTTINGKWESFLIATVANPLPGVEQALVIAGSDKRGTIYGIYEISEQSGVSPWYWWADVPAQKHEALYVKPGTYVQGPPAVKYRGIFLNDEAPCLTNWAKEKFGGKKHEFYTKVFELILRLRGNYLWPAMWDNAFNEDDPENPRLADEYGIVMGTSHHEPMIRSQQEWKRQGKKGPWNYATNEAVLKEFWAKGVERNKNFESLVTMGMRGDGDEPMGGKDMGTNVALLERIVSDQRALIAKYMNPDVTKVPQLWALYKEVQDYYEHGMRVPDDVTLLWCDDNWGNLRRVPTAEERKRSGGAGIYYHFDYVGSPRNYKWLDTNTLPKIWEQMNIAYRYGADRIWIVNVGDLKPEELPIEFFLKMAWNPDALPKEKIGEYVKKQAERDFGPEHAAEIAELSEKSSKYTAWRKPELITSTTFSLINYREAERVSQAWNALATQAEKVNQALPEAYRDAFYQLVLHRIKAMTTLVDMYITGGRNQLYAKQGRASTNAESERMVALFKQDQEISAYYNKQLAGGKWNHMMDQTHIGYTSWNDPKTDIMPQVTTLTLPNTADFGVAVDGSADAWPGSKQEAALPVFDSLNPLRSYVEVFARGSRPIEFKSSADQPWIVISEDKTPGQQDHRLWVDVDWKKVPAGQAQGSITITSAGKSVAIKVNAKKATEEEAQQAKGCFGGLVGPIAIAAQDAAKNVEVNKVRWEKIPDYGRVAAAMSIFPVTASSIEPPASAPCLEYPVYIAQAGKIDVDTIIGPSLNFVPGRGLRLAVSFDDQPAQVLTVLAKADAAASDKGWADSVRDNARTLRSTHEITKPGKHTLKVSMIDPGVVLQELILHNEKLPASYFGPQESKRNAQ